MKHRRFFYDMSSKSNYTQNVEHDIGHIELVINYSEHEMVDWEIKSRVESKYLENNSALPVAIDEF